MLPRTLPRQLETANRWLNRQLWQDESPAAFFDPLIERFNPLWVRGQARARVVGVSAETPDTRTFTLRPNGRWAGFEAGQHVNLSVRIDGARQTRTFSLSSCPQEFRRKGHVRITVKRIDNGLVTPWLHAALESGALVELSQAFGDFTLTGAQKPLFYLAGGSGITPILSHLNSLAVEKSRRAIGLIYLVRDRQHLIAAEELRTLDKALPGLTLHVIHTRERVAGAKLAADDIRAVATNLSKADAYLCGPSGLIDAALPLLREAGVDAGRIHQTLFTAPVTAAVDASLDSLGRPGSLVRQSTGEVLSGDGKTTLLEIAERAGLSPAYGCRQGICRQCTCRKTAGLVMNRLTGRLSGPGEETIQPCISLPQGPVTVEL